MPALILGQRRRFCFEFDLKEEVIIKLKLTTYKYNYDRYLDDLLKFRPKAISQVKDEIGIEIKNSEAIN